MERGVFTSFLRRVLGDESDLVRELCDHLRQLGLKATVLEPETAEAKILGGLGNVIIEGRNIELVQVTKHTQTHSAGRGRTTVSHYYLYHYGVKANVDSSLENKLRTEAKPIRKSFFNRTIVDYKWEGGELAQFLTADMELKNMLVEEGIDHLWTNTGKSREYFWVNRRGDRKEFPTQKAFEAYDRIVQHARSISASQV